MDELNKPPVKVSFSNVTTSLAAEHVEPSCKDDGGTHGAAPKAGNPRRGTKCAESIAGGVAGAAGNAVDVRAVHRASQSDPGADGERSQSELDLFAAAREGDSEEVLRILSIDRSKIINEQDPETRATPLIAATKENHSLTALLLLRLGAKVGKRDQHNQTALSHAIVRKNGTIVLALLSALCGLSGSTEYHLSAALTRRESSLMYALLAELTSVKIGRATVSHTGLEP